MNTRLLAILAAALAAVPVPAPARAAPPAPTADELQRQIDVLGQEIQKLKIGEASSEPAADRPQLSFGPGISKVYRQQSGLSIGGYGELLLERFGEGHDLAGRRAGIGTDFVNAGGGVGQTPKAQFNVLRAVVYVGYKFSDQWVLNSEIEFENGGGGVAVEFLYMDYFVRPGLNFRAGAMLMPMGLTNEIHEPPTYLGSHRPLVETLIIPSTWSQYGAGVFGDAGPFTYRSYVVNGLNASGFAPDLGIREGRSGEGPQNATKLASVTRLDYTGTPGLLAGGSIYVGQSSVTPASGFDLVSVPTRILEAHLQYNWKALDLRLMGAYSTFSRVDALNARLGAGLDESVGSRQGGFYAQAGYDVFSGTSLSSQALVPFARWETLDTQLEVPPGYTRNGSNLVRGLVLGLNYKPLPQVVFKTDYQGYFLGDKSGVDQWNLSMGYVF